MKSSARLWFLGLVVLAAVLNVLGSSGCSSCCSQKNRKGGRIWLINVGSNYGTLEYLDDNNAQIGWGQEVVKAACQAAGITCVIVYAPGSDCLVSDRPTFSAHIRQGEAMSVGGIDACEAYFPTYERQDVALFTDGYFADIPYYFWYINGPPGGSQNDLRIGWAGGPGDEICYGRLLAANGITLNDQVTQRVKYGSLSAAVTALNNGDIDLLFENEREFTLYGGPLAGSLVRYDINGNGNTAGDTNDQIVCSLGPAGLMVKKDRWDFVESFNFGLRRIKDNGVFKAICEDPQWDQTGTKTSWHRTWCTQDY